MSFYYFMENFIAEQPDVMTPLNWQEDMQLFSEFLDRKVCRNFDSLTLNSLTGKNPIVRQHLQE